MDDRSDGEGEGGWESGLDVEGFEGRGKSRKDGWLEVLSAVERDDEDTRSQHMIGKGREWEDSQVSERLEGIERRDGLLDERPTRRIMRSRDVSWIQQGEVSKRASQRSKG